MITKAGPASTMRSQPDARPFDCAIPGHCRTRVFSLPDADLAADDHIRSETILDCPHAKAPLVSNLLGCSRNDSRFRRYAISSAFRKRVKEAAEKRCNRQSDNQRPLFLVLEREDPCETVIDEGTCFAVDQQKTIGGTPGEEVIMAWQVRAILRHHRPGSSYSCCASCSWRGFEDLPGSFQPDSKGDSPCD